MGCFEQDGYVHDAECVDYHGPDDRYFGHEVGITLTQTRLLSDQVQPNENRQRHHQNHYHHTSTAPPPPPTPPPPPPSPPPPQQREK